MNVSELPPPEMSEKYFRLPTNELIQLAEGGEVEAAADLGWRYFIGHRTELNHPEARKWLLLAADQGSHRAMNRLAQWHMAADQPEQAVAWHEKAVEQGSIESLVGLGFLHFHGIGFEQDRAKALEYYEKALAADDPKAHNNMGYLYQILHPSRRFRRHRCHAALGLDVE